MIFRHREWGTHILVYGIRTRFIRKEFILLEFFFVFMKNYSYNHLEKCREVVYKDGVVESGGKRFQKVQFGDFTLFQQQKEQN